MGRRAPGLRPQTATSWIVTDVADIAMFAGERQLEPALSTVQLPCREVGIEAARSLLHALRDEKAAASISLPWTLIARASTESRPWRR